MERILEFLRPIANVFEHVIVFLYNNVVENYGVVIILLTIIVRIILVPLTITQSRSMARMQRLQPELKELQKNIRPQKVVLKYIPAIKFYYDSSMVDGMHINKLLQKINKES